MSTKSYLTRLLAASALLPLFALTPATPPAPVAGTPRAYIVQAASAASAAAAVRQAGGQVNRDLGIIQGVAATLDTAAVTRLRADHTLTLTLDRQVQKADDSHEAYTAGYKLFPVTATNADNVTGQNVVGQKTTCTGGRITFPDGTDQHRLRGWGVTVAVIDSGMPQFAQDGWKYQDTATGTLTAEGGGRCIFYRDFLPRSTANNNAGSMATTSTDQNGHGTHVLSTILDGRSEGWGAGKPSGAIGAASLASAVVARALGADGSGSYSDVIAAIDWIVSKKADYNIKVLNLSLYAPVSGPYWSDPLGQAVMRAWQSGIVVVAAAGNSGPGWGTITVPGNVPYVITVGALNSGRFTTSGYDELAAYSSRGPTESAFVKPDLVIPASRTVSPMPTNGNLTIQVSEGRIEDKDSNPAFGLGKLDGAVHYNYYQLSGTSMAAAEVSALAAVLLQKYPALTNDQVKYRLMTTARPAMDTTNNTPVYNIWEQGAGLVDIVAAINATSTGSANVGMDINADLTTTNHYWGNTIWDPATTSFQLIDPATGQPLPVGAGGTSAWAGGTSAWSGSTSAWAGSTSAWAGSTSAWAGGTSAWAGGTSAWAGSTSLWAGSTSVWAGSDPAQSANTANASSVTPDGP